MREIDEDSKEPKREIEKKGVEELEKLWGEYSEKKW